MRMLIPVLLVVSAVATADWETDVRLTNDPGRSYIASLKSSKCLAVSGDTLSVAWFDDRDGDFEVFFKRSTDQGQTWSADSQLTFDTDSISAIALAGTGPDLHIAWSDDRDGNWETYYKRSTDGGQTWSPDLNLSEQGGNSSCAMVAAQDSVVLVAWHDNREEYWRVFYRRSTDRGATWSAVKRLCDTTRYACYPYLAADGVRFHAVWVDARDYDYEVYHNYSTDLGLTWQTDTRLSNGERESYHPTVAVYGEDVHVAWNDYRFQNMEIYHRRSTDGGATWSSETRLTNDPGFSGYTNLAAWGPNVHLVWYEIPVSSEIFYRLSTDRGLTWGTETRLTNAQNSSMYASVALADTAVHVVWEDARHGNFELYYKRNPNGNTVAVAEGGSGPANGGGLPVPGIVRGVLLLPASWTSALLLDVAGRSVASLAPGVNDVARLRPGVYFVTRGVSQRACKVVLQH